MQPLNKASGACGDGFAVRDDRPHRAAQCGIELGSGLMQTEASPLLTVTIATPPSMVAVGSWVARPRSQATGLRCCRDGSCPTVPAEFLRHASSVILVVAGYLSCGPQVRGQMAGGDGNEQ